MRAGRDVCSPSPRSYGERVGVRGTLRKAGERWTRREPPSPEFELRSNSTSPRKRGEVKKSAGRLLLLPLTDLRLPSVLAARGRGDHFGFVLLRLLGLAIAALLSLGHGVGLLCGCETCRDARERTPASGRWRGLKRTLAARTIVLAIAARQAHGRDRWRRLGLLSRGKAGVHDHPFAARNRHPRARPGRRDRVRRECCQ